MTMLFVAGLIVFGLVVLNGLYVAAEFAIVGVPKAAVDLRAARGERIARVVARVLAQPRRQDRFIATAQLGITLASLGLGMYGEHVLAARLAAHLDALEASRWITAHTLASVVVVAVLTFLHIVLGEMVPKSIALQHAERSALWLAPFMVATQALFYPLVVLLNGLGNGILRAIGISRQARSAELYQTREELQLVIEESQAAGVLRGESGRVLRELFEFGELTAGEVMVPRVRITGIPVGASPETIRAILRASRHTRYPVYEGDFDHIAGMIHIKDLLRLLLAGQSVARSDTRPIPVVPDTAPLDRLLAVMRRDRTEMAVVIDEHGGTAGVVTLEDLFEEVVGPIPEGPDEPLVSVGSDGRLRVPGTMRLDELGQQLGIDVAHEEVDSVGGLVLALLGRPPRVGDEVGYRGVTIEVTAVRGYGVEECAVLVSRCA